MLCARPSVALTFCVSHVSWRGWSAEDLLQVPALIYVFGDTCGVAAMRRPPYLRQPCHRLAVSTRQRTSLRRVDYG